MMNSSRRTETLGLAKIRAPQRSASFFQVRNPEAGGRASQKFRFVFSGPTTTGRQRSPGRWLLTKIKTRLFGIKALRGLLARGLGVLCAAIFILVGERHPVMDDLFFQVHHALAGGWGSQGFRFVFSGPTTGRHVAPRR
jgi:hypothetical protein